MRNVLFLVGIDDSHEVKVRAIKPGGLDYVLQGSIDIYHDLRHPELAQQVVTLGGMQPALPRVRKPDVIFNCITDADSSSQALKQAMQLIRTLQVPVVINRPVHVLKTRRDDVATALADIPGVIAPATIRIKPASHREILDAIENGPGFPAIIRRIGTHGGESMLLLHSRKDASLLEQVACDGSEYYLVRFVDFRDDDGVYRKLRLVIVENQVVARHLLASDHWNVHASTRDGLMAKRPELLEQEASYLANFYKDVLPGLAPRLAAIQQRLKLAYFSIDCAIRPNGDLLVFEANASGNALRQADIQKYPHLRAPVRRLRAAVTQMLLKPR